MFFFPLPPFREPAGVLVQFLHAEDLDATAPQMARHGAARAQGGAAVRRASLAPRPTLVGRQGQLLDQFSMIGCVSPVIQLL